MKATQRDTVAPTDSPPLATSPRQLFLAAAGLVLISGVLVAMALFHLRSEAIQSGERMTASFAHIIEEQTERTVQLIDQRLQLAAVGLKQLDAAGTLTEQSSRALLRQQLKDMPFVRAIWVVDANGRSKYDSDTGNIGMDFSDRAYFQIYRTQPQTTFSVGLPVRSRTNGKWLISASRPLHAADGKFSGVIVAALEAAFFDSVWRMADLGADSTVALWHRNGTLMMRNPSNDESIGKNFQNLPLFREKIPGSPVDHYLAIGAISADHRSFAYRVLSSQPDLVVVVGRSIHLILQPWRAQAWLALLIWAAASAVLAMLCIWLSRTWRQQRLAEASVNEMAQRLTLASDVASIGVWDWDVNAGTFYAAPKCFTMLGDDPGDAQRSHEQWLERIHPEDRNIVDEAMRALVERSDREYANEVRMRHADGSFRWVSIVARVLARNADGKASRILGVRIDVTARKKAEESLLGRESQFRALVSAIPDLIFTSRADGQILSVHASDPSKLLAPPEALVHHNFAEILPPSISQQFVLAFTEAMASGQTQVVDYTLTINEQERHFEGRVVRGDDDTLITIARDVTESKRAKTALQESEERFRILVESSPEPTCVYREAKLVYVNPAAVSLIGASSAEQLVGESVLMRIHPDSRQLVLTRLEGIANGDSHTTLHELKFVRLDGTVIDVEARGTSISYEGKPSIHVCVRDITAARLAETALRNSEVGMAEAQRVARVGSWRWDAVADKVEWSDELYRILNRDLSLPAPNHEDHLTLYTAESAARLNDVVQNALLTGEAYKLDLELRRDGVVRSWVGVRGETLRNSGGQIVGLRGTVQDITQRKLADAARASLEAQLLESHKMEAIGTLAGGIAHDFNNILATILGNATLVRQDLADDPQALQSLDEITKAAARARDLVRQILTFSRRDISKRTPIALGSVVDESIKRLRDTLPPQIVLEAHCEPDLPCVLADASQIGQVIINLVTNAMQAIGDQPGEIAVRLEAVTVDAAMIEAHPALRGLGNKRGDHAQRLVVSDSGHGMDPDTMARIFEPFFTTKAVDEGTGLGLSVVHGIVKAHDGAIVMTSQSGGGASFAIYLPIVEMPVNAPLSAPAPVAALPITVAAAERSGHILYLDDDEALVFMLQRILEQRGYRISGYTDQHEALAALRADPAAFDLVVTDYNMPGMSGLEVAREVRTIRPDMPVTIASGFIDETLREQAKGAGVRELIFKVNALEDLCDAFVRLADAAGGNNSSTAMMAE